MLQYVFSDDDYEQYDDFMLKYACGNPDKDAMDDTEHWCMPIYDHRGESMNGEKCFCAEDYCFDPQEDEKYLEQFRDRNGPVYT